MPMKIASAYALNDSQRAIVAGAAPNAAIEDRACRTPAEVDAVASGCDILLSFRIPDDLPSRAPNCRWVQLLSAGADHILDAVHQPPPNVAITTASGIHATPIAEYTIASMLAYTHRLHVTMRAQMKREWIRGGFMATVDELRGKTLGVIGYGSIGRETARLARAFGMKVLALKRDPHDRRDPGWNPPGLGDPNGEFPERFLGPEQCAEIMAESDYVTVTLPLTPHTRGFVGKRELDAAKPGCYIVNIGRGSVIDERAMIAALKSGKLGGAGLDVFETEPLPSESPLWEMENVILTPHMSGANRGYMDKACELFAENLRRFAANQPLLNLVDRKLGY
ncbi:MAG TPA: D-2-hydroxyacid dehydrogenase [Candidatus Binataceae bacterium]|nr:D-2-hydroxyacid dehydrogenase [Candidatus Binataceae bacterium]